MDKEILSRKVLRKLSHDNIQQDFYRKMVEGLLLYSTNREIDINRSCSITAIPIPYSRAIAENFVSLLLSHANEIYINRIIDIIEQINKDK